MGMRAHARVCGVYVWRGGGGLASVDVPPEEREGERGGREGERGREGGRGGREGGREREREGGRERERGER